MVELALGKNCTLHYSWWNWVISEADTAIYVIFICSYIEPWIPDNLGKKTKFSSAKVIPI